MIFLRPSKKCRYRPRSGIFYSTGDERRLSGGVFARNHFQDELTHYDAHFIFDVIGL